MTTPKPTPETQNSPAAPDEKTSQSADANTSFSQRDGFFKRVRRELNPEPVHPSEAKEIVIMEEGDN
jgi:hypothetical protein